NVPLVLLVILWIVLFLKEPAKEQTVSIDYKGASLLAASLSLILYWLTEGGQSFQRTSAIGMVIIVMTVILFSLFIRVERRAENPIMPFTIWRNPVILYANIVSFTTGFILMAVLTYLSIYFTIFLVRRRVITRF